MDLPPTIKLGLNINPNWTRLAIRYLGVVEPHTCRNAPFSSVEEVPWMSKYLLPCAPL